MKLYMKQKVFSWRDRFYIKDEQGRDRYYVEGAMFSLGKRLHVYDISGVEVAYIQQKLFTLRSRFHVFMKGQQVAEIVKEITLLKQKYSINGPGWDVDGDFLAHDYVITAANRTVATVHKAWMAWGDSYEIDIDREQDEVMLLSVVLAIDAVLDDNTTAAGSASL